MKTNGQRNRSAGHSWEREIVTTLRELGYVYAVTSRSESKSRDDQKVDIMNKDEYENGRIPMNIQAKNTTTALSYPKILSTMPKDQFNVIFHKQTQKQGTRFITKGSYAIMELSKALPFLKDILMYTRGFALLEAYFEYIPEEEKAEVHEKLKSLGL